MAKKLLETPPKKKRHWSRDDSELTVLALPTAVWFALFCFLPMFGIIIAFKDFKGSGTFLQNLITSPWAGGNGLKNFESLFSFGDIWLVIRNTLAYNIVFIILGIVVPVALALLISQLHSKRLAKAYQTAMFLPYFLSWVVVAAVVWGFLSVDKGLVNSIIRSVGGDPVQWYRTKEFWPLFLVLVNLWKTIGYSMVVYLATITGLDDSYYEAAVIDGATKWQQVKYITLPLMKTVIIIMFIMNVGRIFYSDFGLFYQVPQGSNAIYDVTYTIDIYVYNMLKTGTTGMASAAAFIQSVVGCITILVANAVVRKVDPDSALI